MTSPLGILVAKDAIIDTINSLFIGTDARDWPVVQEALAPRLHVDMTSLAGGTPSDLTSGELIAAWEAGLRPIQAVHHQAGNYRVTVMGDEAQAFCYGTATHYRANRSGRNVRTFVGSYDFRLVLLDRWRITSFRFNLKYLDGNLNLERESD
ncbi:MAG TPA: nuclear transport factor 2 family protein [Gemmatimonadales bacterium]|jgi:hypothetical protein